MTDTSHVAPFRVEHMVGDIKRFMLDRVRRFSDKPWDKLSQNQQAIQLEAMTDAARELVENVLEALAAEDMPTLEGKLEKFSAKGTEFQLALKVDVSEQTAKALCRALGKDIIIVGLDLAPYSQVDPNTEPQPSPDQGELPVEPGEGAAGEQGDAGAEQQPPTDGEQGDGAAQNTAAAGESADTTAAAGQGGDGFQEDPAPASRKRNTKKSPPVDRTPPPSDTPDGL